MNKAGHHDIFWRKICVIGDFAVGKSSVVRRYVKNLFDPVYKSTLGVQVMTYKGAMDLSALLSDGEQHLDVELALWDIEGSLGGEPVAVHYLRGAEGAIIVGDVTRDGFEHSMMSHARSFQDRLPGRPFVFAINKCDLLYKDELKLRIDRAEFILDGISSVPVVASSALTGDGVAHLFETLVAKIVERGL